MAFVRQRTAPIREKRLGTLGAWYGSAGSLVKEASETGLIPRIRTFSQDSTSDLIYALELLATWRDVAIVVHGPAGCAAGLHLRHASYSRWLVTNINERDSILGADAKLRAAILEAHQRYAPKAIVVVSSPVVIINNDDIDSTTEALREELSVPIVAVYADGFRSKIGVTGLDVTVHALLKDLLTGVEVAKGKYINLLSLSESLANLAAAESLLRALGLEIQVFPRFGGPGDVERIAGARFSVALNNAEAQYAGEALQTDHDVPFLSAPAPIGLDGTSRWLRAVAEASGLSAQAERLIATETRRLVELIEAAKALRGRKVFIHLSADHAFAIAHLAGEIGLEVIGIKVPYLDTAHVELLKEIAAGHETLPILVGEGQAFEEISLLKSARPDLYVGRGELAVHALRLGIATLNIDTVIYLGFSGLENLLVQIESRLSNTAFPDFLAEGETEPYTQSWRQKSAYWYIKHEVK